MYKFAWISLSFKNVSDAIIDTIRYELGYSKISMPIFSTFFSFDKSFAPAVVHERREFSHAVVNRTQINTLTCFVDKYMLTGVV